MQGVDPNPEGFIGFLEDQELMEFGIVGNGERQFTVEAAEICVLGKESWNAISLYTYLYGPYSKELAADCYAPARGNGLGADIRAS